jgi:hypothetical protein
VLKYYENPFVYQLNKPLELHGFSGKVTLSPSAEGGRGSTLLGPIETASVTGHLISEQLELYKYLTADFLVGDKKKMYSEHCDKSYTNLKIK